MGRKGEGIESPWNVQQNIFNYDNNNIELIVISLRINYENAN